jgi:hypothetical protein
MVEGGVWLMPIPEKLAWCVEGRKRGGARVWIFHIRPHSIIEAYNGEYSIGFCQPEKLTPRHLNVPNDIWRAHVVNP